MREGKTGRDFVVAAARLDSSPPLQGSVATEPRRALNTINGLFVYTYRRRMGMISAIDPL